MIVVRWIVALVTVAYALWNSFPAAVTALYKLHKLPPALATESQRMIPLMNAMAWWQVGVWFLANLLFLYAALRLVTRPREAFGPYVLALLVDLGGWYSVKRLPAYDKSFSPAELQLDYIIIGALVLGAVVYWACSRVRRKRVQPAVLSG